METGLDGFYSARPYCSPKQLEEKPFNIACRKDAGAVQGCTDCGAEDAKAQRKTQENET
jgi:hypothetical protein